MNLVLALKKLVPGSVSLILILFIFEPSEDCLVNLALRDSYKAPWRQLFEHKLSLVNLKVEDLLSSSINQCRKHVAKLIYGRDKSCTHSDTWKTCYPLALGLSSKGKLCSY